MFLFHLKHLPKKPTSAAAEAYQEEAVPGQRSHNHMITQLHGFLPNMDFPIWKLLQRDGSYLKTALVGFLINKVSEIQFG